MKNHATKDKVSINVF